jgi:acylphosphatase
MAEISHVDVHFEGRVQGVGFRFQTVRVAQGYEVTGYVQNLPDGRVRLEAEGAADEVDAFIAAVEDRMTGFIRKTEKKVGPRTGTFRGFTIR